MTKKRAILFGFNFKGRWDSRDRGRMEETRCSQTGYGNTQWVTDYGLNRDTAQHHDRMIYDHGNGELVNDGSSAKTLT